MPPDEFSQHKLAQIHQLNLIGRDITKLGIQQPDVIAKSSLAVLEYL